MFKKFLFFLFTFISIESIVLGYQQELDTEKMMDKIKNQYDIPKYCFDNHYPITIQNYITTIEIKRYQSFYSILISQVEDEIYCFQILKDVGNDNYSVLDEKYFSYEDITEKFMKDMISKFILSTNPARNLE